MFDERTMDTWRRAGERTPPLGREALEALLRPAAQRGGRKLERLVLVYTLLLAATGALALWNVALYRGNPRMLAVELGLALAAAASVALGLRLRARLRRVERADLPLLEAAERRLALHDGPFARWMLAAAFAPWLLSMAINTNVDAVGGTYTINHPLEFALISAVMVGLTWVMLRVSLSATVFELRAVLHDLRAQAFDHAAGIPAARRRTRRWMALGVALLLLGVVAGLWLWWRAS